MPQTGTSFAPMGESHGKGTSNRQTSQLIDRIGPVGRFGKNSQNQKIQKKFFFYFLFYLKNPPKKSNRKKINKKTQRLKNINNNKKNPKIAKNHFNFLYWKFLIFFAEKIRRQKCYYFGFEN